MPPILAAVLLVSDPHSCQILNNKRHDFEPWACRVNSGQSAQRTVPNSHRCFPECAHGPWVCPNSVALFFPLFLADKTVKLGWTNEWQKVIAGVQWGCVCVCAQLSSSHTCSHEENKKLEHNEEWVVWDLVRCYFKPGSVSGLFYLGSLKGAHPVCYLTCCIDLQNQSSRKSGGTSY